MGVNYMVVSGLCTVLSFVGLQLWTESLLVQLKSDGLIHDDSASAGNFGNLFDLLLGSYTTVVLLANFVLNVFVLLVLFLKTMFFVELYPTETRKLAERLVNYVIYKGTFLPLIVPPTIYHAGLWSIWLIVLCCLKMFQALARDRLERLNASPSATPIAYFRVYSVLLLVLFVDVFWIQLCFVVYRTLNLSLFLLLLFEPLSIAFETLQAILVHGFQLLDIWINHSAWCSSSCDRFKWFNTAATGSLLEWKGILTRNLGFFLDMATLLMALGHYLYIWWLHGIAFHLVDVVLFLNIRALFSAIVKRIKGYMKLRKALGALHAALPDATSEELKAYNDECAICREPMAKAKKLHCNHLFHLSCLRSWLDQGLNEVYACPNCRKPLFARSEDEVNPRNSDGLSDEQLARHLTAGLDRQNAPGNVLPAGVLPNQTQNHTETSPWRGAAGLDSSWLHRWPSQGADAAGPSNPTRPPAGLGRVQMMMRHLASVGETYAQTALEDTSWGLWPMNPSQAATATPAPATATTTATTGQPAPPPPPSGGWYPGGGGGSGLHIRTASRSANDNIANILAMAETVREVLPHIPDDIIFQDLQRTNSAVVTVNNLLQM